MDRELKALPFHGNSMWPLIKSGDEVLFSNDISNLKMGDILLFRDSENGEFVVHRIIRLNPLRTKGDWSCLSEDIKVEDAFGLVSGIKRKDKKMFFSENQKVIEIYLKLSKLLLLNRKIVRKISRVGMILLEPMMFKKNDL